MKVLSAVGASLLSGGSLVAQAEAPSLRIPYQFMSARPAYLGGAFTAVADDQNALFFNPAGLAYLDSTFAALLDNEVKLSVGTGGLSSIIDDISKAITLFEQISSQQNTATKIDKIVELGELFSSRTGYLGARSQGYLARKSWGFAYTQSFDAGLGVHAKLLPETLDLAVISDFDLRAAYAHKLLDGKVSLGVAPYYRLRGQGGQANLGLADAFSQDALKEQVAVGQGFGADLGLMIRPVKSMEPTFGLAILNIGDTKFYDAPEALKQETGTNKKPDPLKQVVNAGFSITPVEGRAFVRLSGELREINRPTAAEYKPAFGLETGFRSSYVRTLAGLGWGNGSWSAGFELRTFIKLRFSTYIEPNLFFDRLNNQRVWVVSAGL
jgi:hypothetical protein